MKYLPLILCLSVSFCGAQTVVVSNDASHPVNVACVSGCSGAAGAVSNSTFSLVNVATVTFNGVAQPVSGTFWQTTQPISGTVTTTPSGTQTISGTVTASQATGTNLHTVVDSAPTTAVTGTFYQATQPVSIASMPSTPVTGTFWPASEPVTESGAWSMSVSNFPAAQPVSGTFWQATQPVSVASMPSTPVTGTFWQATQPVSIASMPSTPVTGTFWQATQPVSIASMPSTPVTGTVAISGTPSVSQSGTWTDTPPAITKGTQGSVGFTTQDIKDAGRSYVVLVATAVAGVTTEALLSFQQNKGGVVTQSITSYTITNGKTLRIQGLYCSNRDGTTAVSWTRAAIRSNTAGATTAISGLLFGLEIGGQAALAGAGATFAAPFPDGLEIAGNGTVSIGVSHLDQATTNLISCSLIGYEY